MQIIVKKITTPLLKCLMINKPIKNTENTFITKASIFSTKWQNDNLTLCGKKKNISLVPSLQSLENPL